MTITVAGSRRGVFSSSHRFIFARGNAFIHVAPLKYAHAVEKHFSGLFTRYEVVKRFAKECRLRANGKWERTEERMRPEATSVARGAALRA
jgi:hypothetical protein